MQKKNYYAKLKKIWSLQLFSMSAGESLNLCWRWCQKSYKIVSSDRCCAIFNHSWRTFYDNSTALNWKQIWLSHYQILCFDARYNLLIMNDDYHLCFATEVERHLNYANGILNTLSIVNYIKVWAFLTLKSLRIGF